MPKRNFFLYLASQSARRQQILTDLRIPFKVVSSAYHEYPCPKKSPRILSVEHAVGKVRKAVLPATARWVLGGDTIVWFKGHGLGKPKTRQEALRVLKRLSGKRHAVYTGLALWDRVTDEILTGCAKTEVWMKPFSVEQIENYVDTIHPYDKAGAYAIQASPKIVRKIQGSYSNVVGLPKELLRSLIRKITRRSRRQLKRSNLSKRTNR